VFLIKKSMDVIDIYAWITLYREALTNCIIDNAYRSKYYWLLKLRCKGENRLLKIEPSQRIHLSQNEPSSRSIDKFTSYLRAHVRDGRINNISQPWWERIVVFESIKRGEVLRHYIEILPRGVWVITNSENRILYASRFEEFKDRVIKVGLQYTPPPLRGLSPLTSSEDLLKAFLTGKDLVRSIVSEWGLPGYVAEELLLRTGLYEDKNKRPSEVSRSDLERLIEEYRRLLAESIQGHGYLVRYENTYELYSAFKPRLFEEVYEREIILTDFNNAVDVYFTELELYLDLEEKRRQLEEALRAQKKRIEEQLKRIEELKKEYEEINEALKAIYENYSHVYNVFECILRVKNTRGWSALGECGVLRADQKRGLVCFVLLNREVCFNIRKSLEQQIIELEKRRGELSEKIKRAEEVLTDMEKSVFKIEEEFKVKIYSKPAPKFWFEKYRWTITRSGFLVIAGKDSSQNEAIVKKYLGNSDIFLHADIHGAPATVLIRGSRDPSMEDIFDAAVIAACYSKAWKAGFSYIDVYWVWGNQVSKAPPPGEYLSKGAFMVYGERHYLKVPLVLGVGLKLYCDQVYGDYIKVFVGSPQVVKQFSLSYVLITPGDMNLDDAKTEVTKKLVENAYRKTSVMYTNIEENVKNMLPGSLRIIESGIGEGLSKCED